MASNSVIRLHRDAFVIPKGSSRTWHMPETTRKYCVIFDARARGT